MYLLQNVDACVLFHKKYEDALVLLNQRGKEDEDCLLLKAQVLYRLERYEESLKLYHRVNKSVRVLCWPSL